MRVFLKDCDIPGLEMSRSIGDETAHSVGVIATPTVTCHKIDMKDDLFILWGSTGIWEYLDNNEVQHTILSSGKMNSANALINTAKDRWRKEKAGKVVDDMTVVIVYFN